ncbi:three-Cys-motif partner protein TcmP, partial [Patescibacteria group bacterium]|nr:three-Cys-motif partner protein TcmP [Patescibacteria group bacterium]
MKNKEYYKEQNNLTAAKIEFYQDYIEGYLIKLLMGFGKCFIADLFCGAGKNGNKQGSPLVLIDKAKYILKIPQLQNPQIYILFNDKDKNNIKSLKEELEKVEINENINIFPVQSDNFENILPKMLKLFKHKDIPMFFFLDPFTYSDVKMKHLKEIMSSKFAEVLLFSPIFLSYRFASDKKLKGDHKTRIFVEEFTDKGIYDYENVDDFMKSIKNKIRQKLSLDFVRPILLDDGSRKNSLFLLTKSQEGMMLMNKIALKKSEDGAGKNVKNFGVRTLFGTKGTSKFELFATDLTNEIEQKGQMTNLEIIKFTSIEEFLPKHAKDVLKNLKTKGKIKVFDQFGSEVNQLTKFCIAEKPRGISIFKYI